MTSEKSEKALVQSLKKILDETEAETDPRIRMRLRSARIQGFGNFSVTCPVVCTSPPLGYGGRPCYRSGACSDSFPLDFQRAV